jgi:RNA polymerase sigma factor (sigma-70 family)
VQDRPDAEVIEASLLRPSQFGLIFDRHATVLHRYVVRRLGPDAADSIVGEVFRIAFEKRNTYDIERPSARPWLYGIATNLVAKHRRQEARRLNAVARLAAQRLPPLDVLSAVDSAIDATNRWHRVAAAMNTLPSAERDVLVLHVWESLSYDEIADALTIPVGTVRSRLNRGRNRLRELDELSGRQQQGTTTHRRPPGRMEP